MYPRVPPVRVPAGSNRSPGSRTRCLSTAHWHTDIRYLSTAHWHTHTHTHTLHAAQPIGTRCLSTAHRGSTAGTVDGDGAHTDPLRERTRLVAPFPRLSTRHCTVCAYQGAQYARHSFVIVYTQIVLKKAAWCFLCQIVATKGTLAASTSLHTSVRPRTYRMAFSSSASYPTSDSAVSARSGPTAFLENNRAQPQYRTCGVADTWDAR